MQVKFIRERSLPAVGSGGPFLRVFAIGDVVDLSDIHAQTFVAQGDAVLVKDAPAKKSVAPVDADTVDTDPVEESKPARKRK